MDGFLLGALKLAMAGFILIWILGLSFVLFLLAKAFFLALAEALTGRHKPDKHIM